MPRNVLLCPRPDKRVYETRREAKWVAKKHKWLHHYKCECGAWHVGHKNKAPEIKR